MDINVYIIELKEDSIINELNLKEKALLLPGLKAKWVSRLINHKRTLTELEKKKKKLVKNLIPKVNEMLPVKLSDNVLKEKVEEVKDVSDLSAMIENEKQIVDFLEKTEKIVSSYSYDIGNIVKIVQLETL